MPIKLNIALKVWQEAQQYRKDNKEAFKGIPSGIQAMDAIDELRHPFYGVVVAKNKSGKTALMLTLALAFAKQKFVVLYDSLEMTLFQMCTRAIANASFTDMNQYEHITWSRDDWSRTDLAMEELSRYDFYFTEGKNTRQALREEIKMIQQIHPGRRIIIIVDYAQLMMSDLENDYKAQTELSKWMKSLTLPPNYNPDQLTPEMMLGLRGDTFSILTAVQVTVSYKRTGAKITDASGSGTGAWGNDADYFWSINDILDEDGEPLPDYKEVSLGGRFTRGGTFKVFFNRAQARYEDPREPPVAAPIV